VTMRRQHQNDCRHWWHRYRQAQASAAQVRNLLSLASLSRSLFGPR
jgi:hypothetical protein